MKKEKSMPNKLQNSGLRSSESPKQKPTTPVQPRKPIHRLPKPAEAKNLNESKRSVSKRSDSSGHNGGISTPRDKVKKKLVLGSLPAAKSNYNVTVKRVQFSLLDAENRSQSTLSQKSNGQSSERNTLKPMNGYKPIKNSKIGFDAPPKKKPAVTSLLMSKQSSFQSSIEISQKTRNMSPTKKSHNSFNKGKSTTKPLMGSKHSKQQIS